MQIILVKDEYLSKGEDEKIWRKTMLVCSIFLSHHILLYYSKTLYNSSVYALPKSICAGRFSLNVSILAMKNEINMNPIIVAKKNLCHFYPSLQGGWGKQ